MWSAKKGARGPNVWKGYLHAASLTASVGHSLGGVRWHLFWSVGAGYSNTIGQRLASVLHLNQDHTDTFEFLMLQH